MGMLEDAQARIAANRKGAEDRQQAALQRLKAQGVVSDNEDAESPQYSAVSYVAPMPEAIPVDNRSFADRTTGGSFFVGLGKGGNSAASGLLTLTDAALGLGWNGSEFIHSKATGQTPQYGIPNVVRTGFGYLGYHPDEIAKQLNEASSTEAKEGEAEVARIGEDTQLSNADKFLAAAKVYGTNPSLFGEGMGQMPAFLTGTGLAKTTATKLAPRLLESKLGQAAANGVGMSGAMALTEAGETNIQATEQGRDVTYGDMGKIVAKMPLNAALGAIHAPTLGNRLASFAVGNATEAAKMTAMNTQGTVIDNTIDGNPLDTGLAVSAAQGAVTGSQFHLAGKAQEALGRFPSALGTATKAVLNTTGQAIDTTVDKINTYRNGTTEQQLDPTNKKYNPVNMYLTYQEESNPEGQKQILSQVSNRLADLQQAVDTATDADSKAEATKKRDDFKNEYFIPVMERHDEFIRNPNSQNDETPALNNDDFVNNIINQQNALAKQYQNQNQTSTSDTTALQNIDTATKAEDLSAQDLGNGVIRNTQQAATNRKQDIQPVNNNLSVSKKASDSADFATQNAEEDFTGYCARYVTDALHASGINVERPPSAYQYADGRLNKVGFNQVNINAAPQKGDVMVYGKTSKHPDGHVQIFNGTNWVSDTVQKTPYPYSDWKSMTRTLWRDTNGQQVNQQQGNIPSVPVNSSTVKMSVQGQKVKDLTNHSQYDGLMASTYSKYGFSQAEQQILKAQLSQESGIKNLQANNSKGAGGIAQFLEGTAQRFHINRFDPAQAIDGQAQYMKFLLKKFNGDWSKALAGYNAGEGRVDEYNGVPPFKETQNYVKNILANASNMTLNGKGGSIASHSDSMANNLNQANALLNELLKDEPKKVKNSLLDDDTTDTTTAKTKTETALTPEQEQAKQAHQDFMDKAQEESIRRFSTFTAEQIDNNPALSESQKAVLRQMLEIKQQMADNSDTQSVRKDIVEGTQGSTDLESHLGLKDYHTILTQAIEQQDSGTAKRYMDYLDRFADNQLSKDNAIKQYASQANNDNPVVLAPDNIGKWVKVNPEEYTSKQLKDARAITLTVPENSLTRSIAQEAQLISKTRDVYKNATQELIKGYAVDKDNLKVQQQTTKDTNKISSTDTADTPAANIQSNTKASKSIQSSNDIINSPNQTPQKSQIAQNVRYAKDPTVIKDDGVWLGRHQDMSMLRTKDNPDAVGVHGYLGNPYNISEKAPENLRVKDKPEQANKYS